MKQVSEYIIPIIQDGKNYAPDFLRAKKLIRCGDCKYRDEETANCTRFRKDWYVQSNSFCSWAERRGESS